MSPLCVTYSTQNTDGWSTTVTVDKVRRSIAEGDLHRSCPAEASDTAGVRDPVILWKPLLAHRTVVLLPFPHPYSHVSGVIATSPLTEILTG